MWVEVSAPHEPMTVVWLQGTVTLCEGVTITDDVSQEPSRWCRKHFNDCKLHLHPDAALLQ
jgi:hypothetical protein